MRQKLPKIEPQIKSGQREVNRTLIMKSPGKKPIRKVQDLIAQGTTVGRNRELNKTFDSRATEEPMTPTIIAIEKSITPNMSPKSSIKDMEKVNKS